MRKVAPNFYVFGDRWPQEEKLRTRHPERMRKPVPLHELEGGRHAANARLRLLGEPEMGEAEMIAARLYTGPVRPRAPPSCCAPLLLRRLLAARRPSPPLKDCRVVGHCRILNMML